MPKGSRLFFLFLLLISLSGLGVFWAMKRAGLDAHALLQALRLPPFVLLGLLVLFGCVYLADCWRYRAFARAFGAEMEWGICIEVSILNFFFSWVSPGGVLGMPLSSLYLQRKLQRSDLSILIPFAKSMVGTAVLLLLALFFIWSGGTETSVERGGEFGGMILKGFSGVIGAIVLVPFLLAILPDRLLRALRIEAWRHSSRERLRHLLKTPRLLPPILAATLAYFTAYIGLGVWIVFSFNPDALVTAIRGFTVLTAVSYVSPLPAGSGIEVFAAHFFSPALSSTQSLASVFLFRAFAFLFPILLGFFLILWKGPKLMACPEPTDWVGDWFPILEKMGEVTLIRYGLQTAGTLEPQWVDYPHQQFDGIGSFGHLLRSRGHVVTELPSLGSPRPPGFFGKLRAWREYLNQSGVNVTEWRDFTDEARGLRPTGAWHVFSEEETRAFLAKAKASGISVNSWLLAKLNQAVDGEFASIDQRRSWLIPVNLRGGVNRADETSNHASYLCVFLDPGEDAPSVHGKIHREFSMGTHWAAWWGLHMGRFFGIGGMEKMLRYYRKNRHHCVGTFSNLGAWDFQSENVPVEKRIGACLLGVTVTLSHPIGAGILTWNGRMSMMLQFHPAFREGEGRVSAMLERWRHLLKE